MASATFSVQTNPTRIESLCSRQGLAQACTRKPLVGGDAHLCNFTDFAWIALVFPSWVLLLSVYILAAESGAGRQAATSAAATAPRQGTAADDYHPAR